MSEKCCTFKVKFSDVQPMDVKFSDVQPMGSKKGTVRYDVAQELTDDEQAQARGNIGAVSVDEVETALDELSDSVNESLEEIADIVEGGFNAAGDAIVSIKTALDDKVDAPQTASVGDVLTVEEVDEDGKPVKWRASDVLYDEDVFPKVFYVDDIIKEDKISRDDGTTKYYYKNVVVSKTRKLKFQNNIGYSIAYIANKKDSEFGYTLDVGYNKLIAATSILKFKEIYNDVYLIDFYIKLADGRDDGDVVCKVYYYSSEPYTTIPYELLDGVAKPTYTISSDSNKNSYTHFIDLYGIEDETTGRITDVKVPREFNVVSEGIKDDWVSDLSGIHLITGGWDNKLKDAGFDGDVTLIKTCFTRGSRGEISADYFAVDRNGEMATVAVYANSSGTGSKIKSVTPIKSALHINVNDSARFANEVGTFSKFPNSSTPIYGAYTFKKGSDGYYSFYSPGVHYQTCAYGTLTFNFSEETEVTLRCEVANRINKVYISNLDTTLDAALDDTKILKSFTSKTETPVDITLTVPAGKHYITIMEKLSAYSAGVHLKFIAFAGTDETEPCYTCDKTGEEIINACQNGVAVVEYEGMVYQFAQVRGGIQYLFLTLYNVDGSGFCLYKCFEITVNGADEVKIRLYEMGSGEASGAVFYASENTDGSLQERMYGDITYNSCIYAENLYNALGSTYEYSSSEASLSLYIEIYDEGDSWIADKVLTNGRIETDWENFVVTFDDTKEGTRYTFTGNFNDVSDDGRLLMLATKTALPSGGSSVEIDTTLTESGKAADAKAVGDRIAEVTAALGSYITDVDTLIGGED